MKEQISAYLTDFAKWSKKPYSDDLTTFGWFLFVGVVLASVFLWSSLIGQIKAAAS